MIDLRSDTVTRPTAAMRQAMAEAEVGDDVYGEDPTVNQLQQQAAEMMGKEEALFVASGTMANSIAIGAHVPAGEEALMDRDAHSMCFELGGAARLWGVLTRQFHSTRGVPDLDDVAASIHTRTLHSPGTALIILENTHNRAGGAVIPLSAHRSVQALAREHGVKVHIDGARIFNAAVASGVSARDYAVCADSVSFCLSKGLGCPAGSLLCGSREFIEHARRLRKLLGGGMRQAGVLAACGLIALESMIGRLAEDHAKARRLAEGIRDIPGVRVDLATVQTNMVYVHTQAPAAQVRANLQEEGVLCNATAEHSLRFVTHMDVSSSDMDTAAEALRKSAAV